MESPHMWYEQYKAALLETDRAKLPQRIQAAKSAIDDRLRNYSWITEEPRTNGRPSAMRLLG
jgi:hypothetical protein